MANRVNRVPAALLLDPELSAAAKLVWMAKRLDPTASSGEVEVRTGLSRNTVLRGLAEVTKRRRYPAAPNATLPVELLASRRLPPRAKLLYALLQLLPTYNWSRGEFTYEQFCDRTDLSRNTVKRALSELTSAGWVQTEQESQRRPVRFKLCHPLLEQSHEEAAAAERRLKRGQFRGESIMKEYLSLLIDSDQFTDNARPGFLVNPLTDQPLEFDRFYPPKVAFEFHGSQHDEPDGNFSPEEVKAQQVRDYIKAGICLYRGITLVIIRAEDLSLERMDERIGRLLPRRDLAGHEPLIDLLERASILYQANSPRRG